MIPAPLTFLEVQQEFFPPHPSEFGQPEFSEAPETLNAVDVVLAARELVLMMMHAVVFVTAGHQAVVGLPAVGVNLALQRARAL